MSETIRCPNSDRLAALLTGQLTSSIEAQIANHLETCASCQKQLEQIADGRGLLDRLSGWTGEWKFPDAIETDVDELKDNTTTAADSESQIRSSSRLKLHFLSPPENPRTLGKIGRYDALELIGEGGMGLVFRAHDPENDRDLAIKVLSPRLAENETATRRFMREAQRAAAIDHPNVVKVFGTEEHTPHDDKNSSLPVLLMEFVDGKTLADLIDDEGWVSVDQTIHIGAEIAAGLEAAHHTNAIHRDIKPSNILIEDHTNRVVITDFGLARATDDLSLTQTGVLAGTPAFMSPEQTDGNNLGKGTDLFSLGCVMYAALTGDSPFESKSTISTIERVRNETPQPINEIRDDVPAKLVAIVNELLQKNHEKRPGSAAEVEQRLRALRGGGATTELLDRKLTTQELRRRRRTRGSVISSAVLLLAAFGVWWATSRDDTDPIDGHSDRSAGATDQTDQAESAGLVLQATVVSDEDEPKVFESLQDAIDAAPDGAIIEIEVTSQGPIGPLRIGEKHVTLRGTQGSLPLSFTTLEASSDSSVIDVLNADVIFENLDLHWDGVADDTAVAHDGPRLIDGSHANLSFINCRLQNDRQGCLLQTTACPSVRVDHSVFTAPDGTAIRPVISSLHLLEIEQSILHAATLIESHFMPTNDSVVLRASHSLFSGHSFWRIQPMPPLRSRRPAEDTDRPKARIDVDISTCIFDVDQSLISIAGRQSRDQPGPVEPITELVKNLFLSDLQGSWGDSLYVTGISFLKIQERLAPVGENPTLIDIAPPAWAPQTLTQWQRRWARPLDVSMQSGVAYGQEADGEVVEVDRSRLSSPATLRMLEPDVDSGRFGPEFGQVGPRR